MNFKKLLSEAIDNNIKIIVTGKSGWGKSEMITQVAQEKGMELIDFRLSEVLPEDIVGIPKVINDYYEYVPPKWLYDVLQNPNKKYLLFLDEITQGTPEVLNICYKIFDKVTKVGNHELVNVSVVGATNYANESDYLSELPEPLKKRACMLELSHDVEDAYNYLASKYDIQEEGIKKIIMNTIKESNPRSTEKALNLINNGCDKLLVIPYIGFQNYKSIQAMLKAKDKPEGITPLDEALYDMSLGYTVYKDTRYALPEPAILAYRYNLSEEEVSLITSEWSKKKASESRYPRTFLNDWAMDQDLNYDTILKLGETRTFNPVLYLKGKRITEAVATNQFEALKKLLKTDNKGIFELLCGAGKLIPLNVMKIYRKDLPWNILKEHAKQGWLTMDKMQEFAKELSC